MEKEMIKLNQGPLLEVKDLSVEFLTDFGNVKALNNINLQIKEGEFIGIVGESGSGKSTLAFSISALLPPNAKVSGYVKFKNDIITSPEISGFSTVKMKRSQRKILTSTMANIRWKGISMIFQGAMNSFNPVYTIGKQIEEVFYIHTDLPKEEVKKKVVDLVKTAHLDPSVLKSYPHELSGGMKQRAIIAMALALSPDLVIADEPTTGLDVISQAKIIEELKRLRKEGKIKTLIIISHDLGVVSQLADRVLVMYGGNLFEEANKDEILEKPFNPYTFELLNSYPSILKTDQILKGIPGNPPDLTKDRPGCVFAERCEFAQQICFETKPKLMEIGERKSYCHFADTIAKDPIKFFTSNLTAGEGALDLLERSDISKNKTLIKLENLKKYFNLRGSASGELFGSISSKKFVRAVDDITLEIKEGEILGLVGESGSGKTTLGRVVLRTLDVTSGHLYVNFSKDSGDDFKDIAKVKEKSKLFKEYRLMTQMIFQDPYDSLNPKMLISDIVTEPVRAHKVTKDPMEMEEMASYTLSLVKLNPPERYMDRYPHELSGGERQRVAMARAFILKPKLLVADEPISMLDVSLRASFLNLILSLRKEFNLTVLYITHDIASAKYISDNILVIYLGEGIEYGSSNDLINNPLHPYTKALIKAIPDVYGMKEFSETDIIGEVGNAIDIPQGCRFYDRCPYRQEKCKNEKPPKRGTENHWYICHFSQEELENIRKNKNQK
ncbi:MAG: ABC transporter ATP-binding protein [Thermoplasmata archaeon]|nr:ABC transporter ATP-binding protein [Thermoplasmata archaeon]